MNDNANNAEEYDLYNQDNDDDNTNNNASNNYINSKMFI